MRAAALAALVLLAGACRREEEIQVYRLAKPSPAERASSTDPSEMALGPGTMAGPAAVAAAAAAGAAAGSSLALHWEAPAGWKEVPASGMRAASFQVPGGGDLSVVSLPGDAGGALANVNRWRGQIGLPPLSEGELGGKSEAVPSPAGRLLAVDFPGAGPAQGQRLLAAILDYQGSSWFFKLTGPDRAVAAAKPAYLEFLRGLHPRE